MKRVGGLFDAITEVGTLTAAAWRAARGKRERPEVRGFLSRLEAETSQLSRALRDDTFRFGAYRSFAIRDPKTRTIHAPPFADRVLHHALIAVAGPVIERGAIAHSYACRAGRGQHAALRQARRWASAADWFFKADVRKFYDSVEHARLRGMLGRRLRERRLLRLFDHLLASYATAPGKGLPIGALPSQYLGNFYLDPVDHWIQQTLRPAGYLRYMDDLLLFGGAAELAAARAALPGVLAGYGLELKHGGILNRCALGVPWLGFVLYPDRVRLNRLGRRRLRRRLKDLERDAQRGRVDEAELQARSEALFAHARFADDLAWRRMVTGFSRLGEEAEAAAERSADIPVRFRPVGQTRRPDKNVRAPCAPEPVRFANVGEALERDPRAAGRLLEQHGQELPLGDPQQEHARQPEQEQRLPGRSGSRHESVRLTDDAPSRARRSRDETTGKSPPPADIHPGGTEKAGGGAPGPAPSCPNGSGGLAALTSNRVVGRVTPCAPSVASDDPHGARGVTRPTSPVQGELPW